MGISALSDQMTHEHLAGNSFPVCFGFSFASEVPREPRRDFYSYLSAATGWALATRRAWPMTVERAMTRASAGAARNIHGAKSMW